MVHLMIIGTGKTDENLVFRDFYTSGTKIAVFFSL
jgi:hypothetical protein